MRRGNLSRQQDRSQGRKQDRDSRPWFGSIAAERSMDYGTLNQAGPGLPSQRSRSLPLRRAGKSKLLKLIPTEIIAAYMAVHGIFQGQVIELGGADVTRFVGWTVFFVLLVLTPLYLAKIHSVRGKTQLVLTTLSFVVWVYTLGGPFQMVGWYQPQIASCVLVLWTLVVPLFIESPKGQTAHA